MRSSIVGPTGKLPWFLTILAGTMILLIMVALPIFHIPPQPCPQACDNYGCEISMCVDTTGLYLPKSFWQIATLTGNFIPFYCLGVTIAFIITILLMKGRIFFIKAVLAGVATSAYLCTIITWVMHYNLVDENPRPAHEVTGILLLVGGGLMLLVAICIAVFRHSLDQPTQQKSTVSQSA